VHKQAFRRLSLLLHPDKNKQADRDAATQATQHLNAAYTEVGTADKRARFDARLSDSDGDEVCRPHATMPILMPVSMCM